MTSILKHIKKLKNYTMYGLLRGTNIFLLQNLFIAKIGKSYSYQRKIF